MTNIQQVEQKVNVLNLAEKMVDGMSLKGQEKETWNSLSKDEKNKLLLEGYARLLTKEKRGEANCFN